MQEWEVGLAKESSFDVNLVFRKMDVPKII